MPSNTHTHVAVGSRSSKTLFRRILLPPLLGMSSPATIVRRSVLSIYSYKLRLTHTLSGTSCVCVCFFMDKYYDSHHSLQLRKFILFILHLLCLAQAIVFFSSVKCFNCLACHHKQTWSNPLDHFFSTKWKQQNEWFQMYFQYIHRYAKHKTKTPIMQMDMPKRIKLKLWSYKINR